MSGSEPSTPAVLPSLYNHRCEVCGSDRASFGFDLLSGRTAWYCAAHRADGQRLFAAERGATRVAW